MPKLIERILYIHTYIIFSIHLRDPGGFIYIYRLRDEKNTPVNNIILYILLWRTRLYTHTHRARGDLCLYIYLFGM